MRWSVRRPYKDIAGFYVVIRDAHSQILLEHQISYEKRYDLIVGHEICDTDCMNLELCILTKDSYGKINGWFDYQCKYLPNNLENLKKKYTDNIEQTYIIQSLDNRIQAKSVQNTNNAVFFETFLDMKRFTAIYIVIMISYSMHFE